MKSLTSLLLLALPFPLHSATWVGLGDDANWEDAANWDPAVVPGSSGDTEANRNVAIASPNSGGVRTVTAESAFPTPLKDLRFDAGSGENASLTVNLEPGTVINATDAANSLLTINEGGPTDPSALAVINLEGSLTVGQIRMARDADNPTSILNILPEGSLNMTGGGQFTMRNDADGGTAIFSMSGGSFTSGGNRFIEMGAFDSQLHFSGDATFDGSNLTLKSHVNRNSAPFLAGKSALIRVTGSEIAQLNFKAIEGWTDADNTGGSTTFEFIADAGGIKPITSAETIDLAGDPSAGDLQPSLVVDVTNAQSGVDLVLFDYSAGSLLGSFADVTIIGGGGTLDTAYAGNTQIALTNVAVTPIAGPQISSITANASGDIILTWPNGGTDYQVETTTDLSSTAWDILAPAISGLTYTHTGGYSATEARFYRIRPSN